MDKTATHARGLQRLQGRVRFPLSSEECEILLAFEMAPSLKALSRALAKDASVVSRHLQRIAATGALTKEGQRWSLTPLGRQLSSWTRTAQISQQKIFDQHSKLRYGTSGEPVITRATSLLILGAQQGFDDTSWGTRNHLDAEVKIARLLQVWRAAQRPVVHVLHESKEPKSPLRLGTKGAEFKPALRPKAGEIVIRKAANSAFSGTNLEQQLKELGSTSLVVVGFTTNHCVDATVRAAGDLGFLVFVVADACVAFDRVGPDGALIRAGTVHEVVMANLHQEFASVSLCDGLLAEE